MKDGETLEKEIPTNKIIKKRNIRNLRKLGYEKQHRVVVVVVVVQTVRRWSWRWGRSWSGGGGGKRAVGDGAGGDHGHLLGSKLPRSRHSNTSTNNVPFSDIYFFLTSVPHLSCYCSFRI